MAADWRDFQGINAGYLHELHERYQRDPASVDDATRRLFDTAGAPPEPGRPAGSITPAQVDRIGDAARLVTASVCGTNLIQSIRRYGHLAADIDPLGNWSVGDPSLLPETHGVSEADLRALPATELVKPLGRGDASLWDVVVRLRERYCGTTGYDVAHIFTREERAWLFEAVESGRFRAPNDPIDPLALLDRLTVVEAFERFLQRAFPGKTRFSIEGLDMLVPVLDALIAEAAEEGLRQAFIGMAHRGRLNVMVHVLGKPYEQILAEFKDPIRNALELEGVEWSGDVKYHLGASRAVEGGEEVDLVVSMPPNPSHLEAINPVLEGMVRAAGSDASRRGRPTFDPDAVLPILVHGDAAFPGQGVVAETLNLHLLDGYSTGGTVHIIANNQIGFTTNPYDTRSTLYPSGLARGFKIPIIHVNADDPEACIATVRLAFAYRETFKRDVLIDLVGYRRYGHNEGDEPAFTQPAMYRQIAAQPTVRQKWAAALERRGLLEPGVADAMLAMRLEALQRTLDGLDAERHYVEPAPEIAAPGTAARTMTAVPIETLDAIGRSLLEVPEGFTIHRKLERARTRRREAFSDLDARTVDWTFAEELAFASILADGTPIRLTGEDAERGTFSQRHAALFDATTGARFAPLEAFEAARAAFDVRNSPLSENAAVGFEFGYSIQAPATLVLWEAQYGDFVNGAQVVLDEFLLSARAKWGQEPSLVLLLPHGYEGQGPNHASARPERFLQLAADINMRVVNCTTAAQYFHVLRRQAALLVEDPLPLIVLTPKSLLRHPLVSSSPRQLAEGHWLPVIDDEPAEADAVTRLVLANGKMAVDLLTSDARASATHVAIVRVEQLFPWPVAELATALDRYRGVTEVVWVQEEPENMGAWEFARPALEELAAGRRLSVLARPRSSSPAEGSAARHHQNQQRLIEAAFEPSGPARSKPAPRKTRAATGIKAGVS
ncbi:MAG TPA: 2-oxoglutarate dehydrogenase E1 component [Vicinamibacterales bacterium]|nr:2-oxoglutarate dehydrogenase E1 component [Vicinamibacterales bacterium]